MSDLLTTQQLNILRGKTLAGDIKQHEMLSVFQHIDALEEKLDEADGNDALGTEGWRHFFNMKEK